jgi:Tfp pilus assembly protein PilN
MKGITDFQVTLIASAVLLGLVIGLLLWALVFEHLRMRRWQIRAIGARRETIAALTDRSTAIAAAERAIADAATYQRQRDALAAGRTTIRAVDQSDIEHWKGGAVSWS